MAKNREYTEESIVDPITIGLGGFVLQIAQPALTYLFISTLGSIGASYIFARYKIRSIANQKAFKKELTKELNNNKQFKKLLKDYKNKFNKTSMYKWDNIVNNMKSDLADILQPAVEEAIKNTSTQVTVDQKIIKKVVDKFINTLVEYAKKGKMPKDFAETSSSNVDSRKYEEESAVDVITLAFGGMLLSVPSFVTGLPLIGSAIIGILLPSYIIPSVVWGDIEEWSKDQVRIKFADKIREHKDEIHKIQREYAKKFKNSYQSEWPKLKKNMQAELSNLIHPILEETLQETIGENKRVISKRDLDKHMNKLFNKLAKQAMKGKTHKIKNIAVTAKLENYYYGGDTYAQQNT